MCDSDWERVYVGRVDHPTEQAEKVVIEDGRIRKIGKHLSAEEADGEFIGLLRLSREGAELLRATFADVASSHAGRPFQASQRFETAYLTDLLQELIDRGHEVLPVMIEGGWREIDTIEDFRNAGGEVTIRRSLRRKLPCDPQRPEAATRGRSGRARRVAAGDRGDHRRHARRCRRRSSRRRPRPGRSARVTSTC